MDAISVNQPPLRELKRKRLHTDGRPEPEAAGRSTRHLACCTGSHSYTLHITDQPADSNNPLVRKPTLLRARVRLVDPEPRARALAVRTLGHVLRDREARV